MTDSPTAVELLAQGTGLLTRSHLRELGLQRGAVDAVFRALDVVILPGYSRPMVKVENYSAGSGSRGRSVGRGGGPALLLDDLLTTSVARPGGRWPHRTPPCAVATPDALRSAAIVCNESPRARYGRN
jgi:hypothetical protein